MLLLARTAGDDELMRRVAAEIALTVWDPVEVSADGALLDAPLADLARAQRADAALRADTAQGELELWVAGLSPADPGSTDRLSATGEDSQVVALRVVETLRARTLAVARTREAVEVQAAAAARAAHVPASPAAAAQPATPRPPAVPDVDESDAARTPPQLPPRAFPALWLELGPALAHSPGGVGLALDGWLALRLQPAPEWSVMAAALVPIWTRDLQGDEGSASVSTLLLGAGAALHLVRSPMELQLGAGIGRVVSFTAGEASGPYRGGEDSASAWALYAGPSLHIPFGAGVRACARASVGATLPELEYRFSGRRTARWGLPFVTASVGIEALLLGS